MTDQPIPAAEATAPVQRAGFPLGRTLLWLGIAGSSAALTYVLLRASLARGASPSDETAARIQDLIDEANRLIKTLDEKKNV